MNEEIKQEEKSIHELALIEAFLIDGGYMDTCKNCMHLCLCFPLEDSTWDTPVWECEINKEKTRLDRTCKMFEQCHNVDENEKYKFHITKIQEEDKKEITAETIKIWIQKNTPMMK